MSISYRATHALPLLEKTYINVEGGGHGGETGGLPVDTEFRTIKYSLLPILDKGGMVYDVVTASYLHNKGRSHAHQSPVYEEALRAEQTELDLRNSRSFTLSVKKNEGEDRCSVTIGIHLPKFLFTGDIFDLVRMIRIVQKKNNASALVIMRDYKEIQRLNYEFGKNQAETLFLNNDIISNVQPNWLVAALLREFNDLNSQYQAIEGLSDAEREKLEIREIKPPSIMARIAFTI